MRGFRNFCSVFIRDWLLSDESLYSEVEEYYSTELFVFAVMCVMSLMMLASYRSNFFPFGVWEGGLLLLVGYILWF